MLLFFSLTASAQTYTELADGYFSQGKYQNAIDGYNIAFSNEASSTHQTAIKNKKTTAEKCLTLLNLANSLLHNKSYFAAKAEYKKILSLNPNDSYVKSRITLCDNGLNAAAKVSAEDELWNHVLKEHSYEGYKKYLAKYPQGRYRQTAIDIVSDVDLWNNSVKENTKVSYQLYLSDSKYKWHQEEAATKIAAIEDSELWETARKYNTKWMYNRYINADNQVKSSVQFAYAFIELIDALEAYEQDSLYKSYAHFEKTNELIKFNPDTQSKYDTCKNMYNEAKIKFENYLKKANLGNAEAQHNVAECYYYGQGVQQDYQKSVGWHIKAASQNYIASKYCLGWSYEHGEGVAVDMNKAVAYYKEAAKGKHAKAQYYLGLCYLNGTGVESNNKEAVRLIKQSASNGYDNAKFRLGKLYEAGDAGLTKNYAEAKKWYEQAALSNNAELQFSLGLLFDDLHSTIGGCFTKNIGKALYWYKKAADNGHSFAQALLGFRYELGLSGVEQDYSKAVNWYTKAAKQGHGLSQALLGDYYESTKGVEKNEVEAVKWFMRATDNDNELGFYRLGVCYEKGKGIEQDLNQAVILYELASQRDQSGATLALGLCYRDGKGVATDKKKAFEYILKAHNLDNEDAKEYLSDDLTTLK